MDDTLKQKLKNYVLWLLGRQEYSRRELTQKLQQREASDEFIENLLDWCEKHNFINEQRYCEGFVRKHIFKCHGLKRIQSEAMGKGIDRALLETVIEEQRSKRLARNLDDLDVKIEVLQMQLEKEGVS